MCFLTLNKVKASTTPKKSAKKSKTSPDLLSIENSWTNSIIKPNNKQYKTTNSMYNFIFLGVDL